MPSIGNTDGGTRGVRVVLAGAEPYEWGGKVCTRKIEPIRYGQRENRGLYAVDSELPWPRH